MAGGDQGNQYRSCTEVWLKLEVTICVTIVLFLPSHDYTWKPNCGSEEAFGLISVRPGVCISK